MNFPWSPAQDALLAAALAEDFGDAGDVTTDALVGPELPAAAGWQEIVLRPLDPGIVFEKVVVDYGGYTPQFLFGEESVRTRIDN